MRKLLWVLLIAMACTVQAQQVLLLSADTLLPRRWRGPFKVDTAQLDKRLTELHNEIIGQGYLAASNDGCVTTGDTVHCTVHLGKQYRWAHLSAGTVPTEIASASGFRERFYSGRPVTPPQLERLFNSLINQCENNGYPFAKAWLDSIVEQGDGLSARLQLQLGRQVVLDSVVVKGTARINPRYLQAYIGIAPGDLYNELLVRQVDQRTRELPFVTTRHPAYLLFNPEQTKLYLFLDARKASNFNGIIGVARDPISGKVQFTGDMDLKLRNALHRGEAIDLNWRSLQDRSQDLKLGFNLPYVFNTPFGTDLGLKLFKQDTTFLEVNARAGLEYLLQRGDKVRAFVNNKSSKRLGQQLVAAPGLADVNITSYGLGLHREHFDYRFNPRRGSALDAEGSAGKKRSTTALINDTIDNVHRSMQYELTGQLVWHIPLGRRGTLRLAGQAGSMVNDRLYANELFRIGGIKSLRGVAEASIYASSYAIGTAEYRFLFEENSNLFLFVDQAWWEDQSRGALLTDTPLGVGVGTSFETKAGIFAISYALGRQFNNPVELRNGKVHFGFSSLF